MTLRIFGSVLFVVGLGGCVVVDKDIDSDTGTGNGTMSASSTVGEGSTSPTASTSGVGETSTSSDDSGLPTTGATGTGTTTASTTDGGTSAEPGTTGTSTEAGTSAESTTGEPTTIEGACEAACLVFLECQPDAYPDLPTCAAECLGGAGGGPDCEAAAIVFNSCIGGYDCAQLLMALEDNQFGACTDAFDVYVKSCNP